MRPQSVVRCSSSSHRQWGIAVLLFENGEAMQLADGCRIGRWDRRETAVSMLEGGNSGSRRSSCSSITNTLRLGQ